MFYPIYETNDETGELVMSVAEYTEDDIVYESHPVEGFADDKTFYTDIPIVHDYGEGKLEDYTGLYYMEEGYDGEDTLEEAKRVLVKWIF